MLKQQNFPIAASLLSNNLKPREYVCSREKSLKNMQRHHPPTTSWRPLHLFQQHMTCVMQKKSVSNEKHDFRYGRKATSSLNFLSKKGEFYFLKLPRFH